jgi:hypothetical protein
MDVRAVCLGMLAPIDCGARPLAKPFKLQHERARPGPDAYRLVKHFGEAADFDSFLGRGTEAVMHPARRTCG